MGIQKIQDESVRHTIKGRLYVPEAPPPNAVPAADPPSGNSYPGGEAQKNADEGNTLGEDQTVRREGDQDAEAVPNSEAAARDHEHAAAQIRENAAKGKDAKPVDGDDAPKKRSPKKD
jgi:hypothetical protein